MPLSRLLLLFIFSFFLCLISAQGRLTVRKDALHAQNAEHRVEHVPYNPLMALYALHLCKASYCVPEALTTTTTENSTDFAKNILRNSPSLKQQLGFELYNVYINISFGTLAYTAVDHINERVLAVFRGSANLNNWLSDLTFWSDHYPCPENGSESESDEESYSSFERSDSVNASEDEDLSLVDMPIRAASDRVRRDHYKKMTNPGECRVHRGFYRAYHSLSHNLSTDLLQLHREHPRYSFFLTGHSLGGALAYLSALHLTSHPAFLTSPTAFFAPFEVYTFGEPRSGNVPMNRFATTLLEGHVNGNRKHFRLTHGRDPVPHLPPQSFGYRHQPQELWYFRNGTADDNPFVFAFCHGDAMNEDVMCSNSVWSTTIADHTWYMGTCTACLCASTTEEEEEKKKRRKKKEKNSEIKRHFESATIAAASSLGARGETPALHTEF